MVLFQSLIVNYNWSCLFWIELIRGSRNICFVSQVHVGYPPTYLLRGLTNANPRNKATPQKRIPTFIPSGRGQIKQTKKIKNDTKTRIFKDLKKRFYCYFLSCSIFIIKATKIKTQIVLFSCDQNCIIAKCSGFIFSRKKR